MSMLSLQAPLPVSIGEAPRRWLLRVPKRVKLLLAASMLLVAATQLWIALEPRADAIAGGLNAAAADVAALPWSTPPEAVQQAVAGHFPSEAVRVDPTHFPIEVKVALAGLDRDTCLAARHVARRIEGSVVVQLDGYGEDAACGQRNTMTWRIMP
jgi:hypothetical protein